MTKEVLELRDKLDSAYARIAEGDQIATKAATLAEENVRLKSTLDEVSSQKLVAEEKMHLLESVLAERYIQWWLEVFYHLVSGNRVGHHAPLLGHDLLDGRIKIVHANFQVSASLSKKVLIFFPKKNFTSIFQQL